MTTDLDVARLAAILHDRHGHTGPVCPVCRDEAKAIARDYAALEPNP